MTHFAENFWSEILCDFTGYDVLCKRMRDGKLMCKEISDFIRKRAEAEERYGKELQKLAKSVPTSKDDTCAGSLSTSWDVMRKKTELISECHLAAAHKLSEQSASMAKFVLGQKQHRSLVEESMKKIQASLKLDKKLHDQAYKSYVQRSEEADLACNEFEMKKNSVADKDLEKLNTKKISRKQQAESSDQHYRKCVANLERRRRQWIKDHVAVAQTFERLEIERIQYLRNEMWIHTNFDSQLCVARDECNEDVRVSLERCDVDGDIDDFVLKRATGTSHPDTIAYHPYTSQCVCNRNKARASQPVHLSTSPDNNDDVVDDNNNDDDDEDDDDDQFVDDDFDIYDQIGEEQNIYTDTMDHGRVTHDNAVSSGGTSRFKVLYNFEAESVDELSVMSDDVVEVLSTEGEDWWECVLEETGHRGLVPATYLHPLDE